MNLYSWKKHFLCQHSGLMLPKSPWSFWGKWQSWCGDVPNRNELLSPLRSGSSYLRVTKLWCSVTAAIDLARQSLATRYLNSSTIHALNFNVIAANTSDAKQRNLLKRKLGSLRAVMGNIIFQRKGTIYIFKKLIQDQKQWPPLLFFF